MTVATLAPHCVRCSAGVYDSTDSTNPIKYMVADHLGSVVATTSASGTLISQQRYMPFGQVRQINNSQINQTDMSFTGQRNLDQQGNVSLGLDDYHARFYDDYLNRFISPDSIIPSMSGPQSWNRYSYANNNPIYYTDSDGHDPIPYHDFIQGAINFFQAM